MHKLLNAMSSHGKISIVIVIIINNIALILIYYIL